MCINRMLHVIGQAENECTLPRPRGYGGGVMRLTRPPPPLKVYTLSCSRGLAISCGPVGGMSCAACTQESIQTKETGMAVGRLCEIDNSDLLDDGVMVPLGLQRDLH